MAGLNWSENAIFDLVRIFLLELVRFVHHILELVRPGKTPLIGIGSTSLTIIGIGPTTFYYFGIGPTSPENHGIGPTSMILL